MKKKLAPEQLEAVARIFAVLSEASRLALLHTLRGGPRTVSELVEASGMRQANVSKHLGLPHHHGLVRRQREGSYVRYEVADPVVFAMCELVRGRVRHLGW